MNFRRTRRLFVLMGAVIVAAVLTAMLRATPIRAADDVTDVRAVSGFERIRLQGAFTTDITAGERGSHVVVTASRDDVARITTEVQDGTLVVGMRSGDKSSRRAAKISIVLPVLRAFTNEGAGSAKIRGISGNIAIENDGAASIVAAGRAARLEITLNGTGQLDTTAVEARDVTVDNNGVGSVRVRASGQLTMNVNGIGEIRYTGDPAKVEQHVNGIGSINRM